MASRLSVLMIQSKPPGASAQKLVDEVVGQLIGAGGLDLMLIEPPSTLSETATDRLTLESLAGDVAVLDWQDPERIVLGLAAVNFRGQRTPHPHDPDALTVVAVPPVLATTRRVYAYDLNRFNSSREVLDALQALNSRRQVRIFGIGVVPRGPQVTPVVVDLPPTPKSDHSKRVSDVEWTSASTHVLDPADAALVANRSGGQTQMPGTNQTPNQATGTGSRREPSLDLDDLLDQLDQADP